MRMETEKYQKELFEFESPKKAAARFGNMFSRTDFAITLTPEKMVFMAIGIMMLMVVFFALGVEKGKSARAPVVVAKSAAATNITPRINPPAATVKARAVFDKTKPYTVVAAAFSREDLALKEVGKLRMAGLDAFVHYGESYYLACVGSFPSREGSLKILNKIRQMHRDAYVKLR